jgi:dihydroorotate dehydrogenase
MFYRILLRPLLFLLPAETAHRAIMAVMAWFSRLPGAARLLRGLYGRPDPALRVQAFGRELSSPLGLAAGLDKDAEAFEAFFELGFGSVEVGTITGQPQPGNPRPRLFRLPRDRALINRMGFNNAGADRVAARLAARLANRRTSAEREGAALGINIGKTKAVPAELAIADYVHSATRLAPYADYMVVNVSSPNTPGLRDLQSVERLRPLLGAVRAALDAASGAGQRVPLLVKIAPDLADADIDSIVDLALELALDGIVAVNTTLGRQRLHSRDETLQRCGEGGLSGAPLRDRALEVLRRVRARAGSQLLIISVGGVETVRDVWERWRAGASLIQLYTALIYEGPGLVKRLHRELLQEMALGGYRTLAEVRDRRE